MLNGKMLHGQMLHGQMLHGQMLHGQMLHGQMVLGHLSTVKDAVSAVFAEFKLLSWWGGWVDQMGIRQISVQLKLVLD